MGGRKVLLAVVAVTIATLLVLFNLPSLANAAEPETPPGNVPVRPAKPSADHTYAVKATDLTGAGLHATTGGWSERNFSSTGGVLASSKPARKVYLRLQEPQYTTAWTLGVEFSMVEFIAQKYSDKTETAEYFVNASSHTTLEGYMVCAPSAWSTRAQETRVVTGGLISAYGAPNASHQTKFGWNQAMAGGKFTGCTYIKSIVTFIRTYTGYSNQFVDTQVTWSAERFYTKTPYKDLGVDETYCVDVPFDPICDGVTIPVTTATMCAGAPQPKWLDFSWLPRFTTHYARCLWVPYDPLAQRAAVDAAWEASEFRKLLFVKLPIAAASFQWSESCGVLFDVNPDPDWLPRVRVDSCTWSSWISPALHVGINIFVWSAAAIGYIFIVVRLLLWTFKQEGVMNS